MSRDIKPESPKPAGYPSPREVASEVACVAARQELAAIDRRAREDAKRREVLVDMLQSGRMLPEVGSRWVAVPGATKWSSIVKAGTVYGCVPLYDDRGNRHIVVFQRDNDGEVCAITMEDFVIGYVPAPKPRKRKAKGASRG